MKRKIESVFVPFPKGMLSTVRAPLAMPPSYARQLENMLVQADGSGSKRNGFTPLGTELVGENIVSVLSYTTRSGVVQIVAGTASGKIYVQVEDVWSEVFSGLSSAGVLRGAYFDDKLILCNGVDDVLLWDGTTMALVQQYITDPSTGLTRIDGDSFSIESGAELYLVGGTVRFTDTDGNTVETTVVDVSGGSESSSGPIIVNVAAAVIPLGLTSVAYVAKPPKFREIYAAHDRLWGIGETPLSAAPADSVNRMRVFYTAGVNDPTAWHDAEGFLQSINLTDKTNTADELMTMRVKDGLTLFFGRENVQVWGGVDPTVTGDFTWRQTIPVGVAHPNLVVDMPNDIGFLTRFGLRTLSRVLQTETLAVGDIGREVDTQLAAEISALVADDAAYKTASSFAYPKAGWFGFKVKNKTLIFQISGAGQGWAVFTGLFGSAAAITADGSQLLAASGGQILRYDDSVFADNGAPIACTWFTPWIAPAGGARRFAAMALEVLTEQAAALSLNVLRYREYDTSRPVELTTGTNVAADFWDVSGWDASYFDNGMPETPRVRDPYVASVAAYKVEEVSTSGPLTIFGLKLYGIKER